MTGTFVTCAALMLAGVISSSSLAVAEDAITHPASKTIGASSSEMVASLGVINADGATLEGGKLTLTGVSPNTIVFADRPVRAAGDVLRRGPRELRQDPP